MASAKTGAKAPAKKPVAKQEFVGKEEFNTLSETVDTLSEGIAELLKRTSSPAATPEAVKEEKETAKASPNKYTVNPEWEELAREIIGEAVDHTEIQYVKGGGLLFTIVVREEFSNAPDDYMERYKSDRRSKEVGAEGEAGVRQWCEQVRNHLKRPKLVSTND